MRISQMSLLVIGGLFDAVLGANSNVLPVKEVQFNLLADVRELFQQLKVLVEVETNSTDKSLECDTNKIVKRAQEHLGMMEEVSLMKIACRSNSVCALDYKQRLQRLFQESAEELNQCVGQCYDEMSTNSLYLTNATVSTNECAEHFLDTMSNCSRKPGLHVISCYKDVIAKDVPQVKEMLLEAIEAHKEGHLRTIRIRNIANDCVDYVSGQCRTRMGDILNEALHCT